MDKVTIPPDALAGLAVVISGMIGRTISYQEAEAAARALLKAWPGAVRAEAWDNTIRHGDIILPTPPQETNHE